MTHSLPAHHLHISVLSPHEIRFYASTDLLDLVIFYLETSAKAAHFQVEEKVEEPLVDVKPNAKYLNLKG